MRLIMHSQFAAEDHPETEERIRKGRGRQAAFTSSKPEVRKAVRMSSGTEHRKILRAARSLKVTLQCEEPLTELRDLAFYNYQALTVADGRVPLPWHRITAAFMDRITVNYLRHIRTSYDQSLIRNRFSGGSDMHVLYNTELKIRCLDTIAATFPELEPECTRQRTLIRPALDEAAETFTAAAA